MKKIKLADLLLAFLFDFVSFPHGTLSPLFLTFCVVPDTFVCVSVSALCVSVVVRISEIFISTSTLKRGDP